MGNSITGKEYPLYKIFSNEFEFHIPAYQRPYAWTETETEELFQDLYEFFTSEKDDSYFLGCIVLIKNENEPLANVIDGQQRLTTLTILLSVLEDFFEDPEVKGDLREYIQSKGKRLEGIEAKPRLFLREKDQAFFYKYIQEGNLDELVKLDQDSSELDTEAKMHIWANCRKLMEEIKDKFDDNDQDQLKNFSSFLVTKCYMVAVSTPSQNSAFRVFSVMNSRGLDLLPIDIIKSDTIGKIPENERDKYTKIWEDLENETGRDGFNEVFTHTRTIFAKERLKKNLLEEFKESVLPKTTPQNLIDDYLTPYTEAYIDLKSCQYESSHHAEDINQTLYWLNKTNNHDWMPSAIKFFSEHKGDSAYLCWFVKKLERLASYLLVTGKDVNQRFYRYNWLLVEMDERPENSLEHPLKNIELTDFEKENFVDALNGDIYTMPSLRRNYIIQRLDSFVGDGGATYNTKLFTIEHVLPQNPAADSEWAKLWPDEEIRKQWLNRIANLVPLTRKKNSAAQNYDFEVKKEKYFQTKNGISSFNLTTHILNYDSWTPESVEKRQEELIEVFKNKWDLNTDPISDIRKDSNDFVFLLAGRGGSASGYPADNDQFVVKKGSRIASDTTDSAGYSNLRERLIEDKVIVNNIFVQDYVFDSPTAAATIILGRSSNGRREWTCLDGRTLAMTGR